MRPSKSSPLMSKMSPLTHLNLYGLVQLAQTAATLKLSSVDVLDDVLRDLEKSKATLIELAARQRVETANIASYQLIEEVVDNFEKIKTFRESCQDQVLPTVPTKLA